MCSSDLIPGCNCSPSVFSSDGKIAWVSTRGSNYILGFSTAKLQTQPGKALVAKVLVGQAPIGEALVKGGSRLIVADNDGKPAPQTTHELAVIDPAAALAGKTALVGHIATGAGPHEFAVSPDGTFLYVTDLFSSQIQVVDLRTLH